MESHLFTIAPHGRFLDLLVDRVLDGTLLNGWDRTSPFWLSDVTIVLPTRRARLALAEAFARRGQFLLPDIRTFGGEATEEEPFLPPVAEGAPLPHPAGLLERRLALAAMTSIAYGRETSTAEVLALADTLGEVIDDLHVAGIHPSALRDLDVSRDLAANWQKALKVLEVVLVAWPEKLAERGRIDAAQLRNLRLRRQAATLPAMFGDRPVIAAGSTGSIPATADLLGAIAKLPRGALVLPGLDTSLDAETFAALQKPAGQPHGHPQYGLVQLVQALGSRPGLVEELAPAPSPRTAILNRALALAEDTAAWAAERAALAPQMPAAAEGLTLLAARTEEGEARAIALATRDAVFHKQTVGIVTPDRNLARRIAAELRRFGIEVDDSAGTPLFQSPAGRLVRQVIAVAAGDFAPVATVALLRNRAVTVGRSRGEVRSLTDALDYDLRGKLLRPGIEGLKEHAATWVVPLLETLAGALAPLQILLGGPTMRAAVLGDAVLSAVRAIAALDDLPGGPELVRWTEDLALLPGEGPMLPPVALDAVMMRLMDGYTVRSAVPQRDDVFIWGRLEARLQSPDLMILAGLNEDVWPEAADPGPWLSRGMRLAVGLEPPERRHGLAAHDFLMAAGNAEVVVAWAERIGGSPATPSRLVQRLAAFLGAEVTADAKARGRRWIVEAQRLDATGRRPRAAQRPMPRPPATVRPRRLSVTEIEKLFRSPYDIYARHVLKLRALDPLGQAPGGRERGNLVHDVFAQYIGENLPFDASAVRRLADLADEVFSKLETIADRRDIWLRRFIVAAGLFVEFERGRHADIAERHAEIKGEWAFPNGFTLVGKADRVDIRKDGTLEILDFKTGAIPAVGEMQSFMAPQLLLEAAMAQAVGIHPVKAANVSALTYIKIGSGEKAYRPEPFRPAEDDLAGAIAESVRRLQGHVDALLLKDTLPMAARVIPDAKQRFRGEFDHLARTEEWLVQEDEDLF